MATSAKVLSGSTIRKTFENLHYGPIRDICPGKKYPYLSF